MDPASLDPAKASTCTSCTFSEDFSNYWTANVYFRSPENGTYKRVPQGTNGFSGQNGGITVYYIYPYTPEKTVTAFKPVSLFFSLCAEIYTRPSFLYLMATHALTGSIS